MSKYVLYVYYHSVSDRFKVDFFFFFLQTSSEALVFVLKSKIQPTQRFIFN